MSEDREAAASFFDAAAEELERAAKHCRTAARHFRDGEVPRAGAHAWAVIGHMRTPQASLDEQARAHAKKASP